MKEKFDVCLVWPFGKKLIFVIVKLVYSEKATKFCEISTLLLPVCIVDKSKEEIS